MPAFGSPELLKPHDLTTERDLAILRGFKQQVTPAGVLDWLRLSGLDDEEPWTEQRVIERHDFFTSQCAHSSAFGRPSRCGCEHA